jgi:hypothetical protein
MWLNVHQLKRFACAMRKSDEKKAKANKQTNKHKIMNQRARLPSA